MSREMKKKYAIWMVTGVILNLGLYYIAHVFKLPVWMDSIGTVLTAVMIEPAAGLLVAFGTNFFQAAVIYDSSSLIYYMVSACAALAFGIGLRKNGEVRLKRLLPAAITYVLTATVLGGLITLWRTAGVPDSGWEQFFYKAALAKGIPNAIACMWGTFVLKAADTVIISVILAAAAKLLPPKWINKKVKETVSFHNPLFQKEQ